MFGEPGSEDVMDLSYAILGLRMMGWAGHVAHIGEGGVHGNCWGNLRERYDMENPRIAGTIILKQSSIDAL
jgi:hypothetical protein